MDLTTTYLGFDLPHPLMPGASPMADSLDTVRRLEDAGAAAIVMRSLFEEQIVGEQMGLEFICHFWTRDKVGRQWRSLERHAHRQALVHNDLLLDVLDDCPCFSNDLLFDARCFLFCHPACCCTSSMVL